MMRDTDLAPERAVCLFHGRYDTRATTLKEDGGNERPSPHQHAGQPYGTIDGKQIVALLKNPGRSPKGEASAIIPSRFIGSQARSHAAQFEHGRFIWSCHDLDSGNHDLSDVVAVYEAVFPDIGKLIYSSASAQESDKRWRVLMPMKEVAGRDYPDIQMACFDLLDAKGLKLDRALSRCGQPVFLPNVPPDRRDEEGRPFFYQHQVIGGSFLSPDAHEGIQAKLSQRRAHAAAVEQEAVRMRGEAAARKMKRIAEYGEQKSPIDAFNSANPLEVLMPTYGYKPAGGPHWVSPNSKSRSASVRIFEDHWCSLSESDNAIGRPGHAGRWGDAFDLFVHYEHEGNSQKAVLAAAEALKLPSLARISSLNDFDLHPQESEKLPQIAARSGRAFNFVQVGQLQLQKPVYLIEGLIETGCLGLIFGDPGHGKSFVAVDLGLSVATGQNFHGHSTKKGSVFYIAGEGHSGLVRRFYGWAKHHGLSLSAALMFKSEGAAQFLDSSAAEAVTIAVSDLAAIHGSPALIIVDTLARNFGPGDENSTAEMGRFVAAMDRLRGNWPESVLLIVHHTGHSDKSRARGAMALKGALDFEYRVEKDADVISLSNTKMKDAEPPPQLNFTLTTVELNDAASAVLVLTDRPAPKARMSLQDRVALESYQTAARETGVWEDGSFRGVRVDDWRKAFNTKHSGDTQEAKKKAFQRARNDLLKAGQLLVQDDVYLITDPSKIMEIMVARDNRDKRDIAGHVPTCPGTNGTNA